MLYNYYKYCTYFDMHNDDVCVVAYVAKALILSILGKIGLQTQPEVITPDDKARPKSLLVRMLVSMLILVRVGGAISFTLLWRQELYTGVGVGVHLGGEGGGVAGPGDRALHRARAKQRALLVQERYNALQVKKSAKTF